MDLREKRGRENRGREGKGEEGREEWERKGQGRGREKGRGGERK